MFVIKTGKLLTGLIVALGMLSAASCGTAADTSGGDPVPAGSAIVDRWWETATPDFSDNPDRPVISLNGGNVISLNVGDVYIDEGATAADLQDGDLTLQISVDNPVDTTTASDYVVRYSVTDSSQSGAIEVVRVVRVIDGSATRLSLRPVGTTASHLGFIEHLPAAYTDIPGQKFPLLIFNHGSGANASRHGENGASPLAAVSQVTANGGPALVISRDQWFPSDSFIVLSPQTVDLGFEDPIERLNAFVEFAISTYNVDTSRIYLSGWSSGASLSLAYSLLHSDRVAAVVPIAAGLRVTDTTIFPDGFCDIENVPLWAFHGSSDSIIPFTVSTDNHESIINNCLPAVTPKVTVYKFQDHFSHHGTYTLNWMENGVSRISGDPTYDLYDQSIFEWLLSHTLENRSIP